MHHLIQRNAPLLSYVIADLRKLANRPSSTSFYTCAFRACKPTANAVVKTS